ncbi:PREDICTED: E3 ubiquitin-protein ligase MIB2-like isoform X1 [Vollenhovia emeryi]|uniref:E3 ubiquitin-protein ligase MIB2-like isoform X1 n=1 Tax=Vollenhovia emeryi TaxID=411798 RepID=UPI0005F38556|nr:PREDICTED: E3 ubiquitin-protein ligase MIB2-like isoform X1 [Vollenhovia emeryi]XP_011869058.1 PREDICTED: E3 ubiquitin-protein ligase MIB2-like isoform X1 [Vollenhovia emeryi]XP_011869059.1 PREDICTED: E3 ubiquitin-protein ligase MIB2-like isoform X1 [Vollenhovia emeryi]
MDGLTPLHLAAYNGDKHFATVLLDNGGQAMVDLSTSRQQTALHLATWQGHWSLVELLVQHNANVGLVNDKGDTALHIAIAESLEQQPTEPTLQCRQDSPLIYAIWQKLARQGARTELALACFLVSMDRSCKLLEQFRNNKDQTPLDLLEGTPQAALLANLLRSYKYQGHSTQLEIENNPATSHFEPASSGTNVTPVTRDNANEKSFEYAIRSRLTEGAYSNVEELLEDADKSKAGVDVRREFPEIYPSGVNARILISRETYLHVAACQGWDELCALILDTDMTSVHAKDNNGNTPLHYAAFGNQMEIIQHLLAYGAAINAVNDSKCSALHVAVNKRAENGVGMLLFHACHVNLQNAHGNTALHEAIERNKLEIITMLTDQLTVDLTLRNDLGCNVLHLAALKGNADAMEFLVLCPQFAINTQLVDVKIKEDGFAPLHLAALNGHREVANILLSLPGRRAKVDLRNNRRQTPLHLATSQGHWSLVELLVHHNADLGSTDEDGNTVLHIAIAKSTNQQSAVPTSESSRDSPLIYAIWQNLAEQGAKTQLALACFLISVDKSGTLLEKARNNQKKTPLDLLEGTPQATLLADLLRSYKYQSHSTQLEIENNPSTSYVEPPTYRIDNISQSEGLRGAKKNVAGSGDAAECRNSSGIIADAKQENRIDPSSSVTLVGCARRGHTVVKTQALQDGQLATGEGSIANPEDRSKDSLEGKRKEEIVDREKEKDKERLCYLETRVADLEKANTCSICMERRRNVAFLCGHRACEHCAAPLKTCHMCRKRITKKINLC